MLATCDKRVPVDGSVAIICTMLTFMLHVRLQEFQDSSRETRIPCFYQQRTRYIITLSYGNKVKLVYFRLLKHFYQPHIRYLLLPTD